MAKVVRNLLSGSKNMWHLAKGVDTTTSRYWLNWRALLCCTWILTAIGMAAYLIKRYEGPNKQRSNDGEQGRDDDDSRVVLYAEDIWKPCLKQIHPLWLMAFRIFAFFVLLLIIILNAKSTGGVQIFMYYTDWTFTLLIIYFGFGSLLSMYGCYHYTGPKDRRYPRQVAGFWGYSFQITFQMVAGAVVLTDCIFWFIIVPLSAKSNNYLKPLSVTMHSANVLFLLGDAALNSLRFPWFRIAHFLLWTCFYVVFQYIIHACIHLWWPYPFLDISLALSPLWYLLVGLLHAPCYGVFILVIKLKHFLLKIFLQDG